MCPVTSEGHQRTGRQGIEGEECDLGSHPQKTRVSTNKPWTIYRLQSA